MALFVIFLALVALAVLAQRYGVDTRDGRDWQPRTSPWAPSSLEDVR